MKNNIKVLCCFLLILCSSSCKYTDLIYSNSIIPSNKDNNIRSGFIDLRECDFNDLIILSGTWLFYPNKFLVTDSLSDETGFIDIPVPKWWNDVFPGGKGYGTYKITVIFPERLLNSRLSLYQDHYFGAYRLYMFDQDMRLIGSSGNVADSKQNTKLTIWKQNIIEFTLRDRVVTFYFETANFTFKRGGFHIAPALSKSTVIRAIATNYNRIVFFVIGALITCALFTMSQVFIYKEESQPYWILVLCITGLYNYFYRINPDLLPMEVGTKIFIVNFHIVFFSYYRFFRSVNLKWLNKSSLFFPVIEKLHLLCSGFILLFVLLAFALPFDYLIHLATYFRSIPLLIILYILIVLTWLIIYKNKIPQVRTEVLINLISIISLMTAVIISVLFHNNRKYCMDSSSFIYQSVSLTMVTLSQSLLIYYRTSLSRKKAEKDRAKLSKIIKEKNYFKKVSRNKTDLITSINHEIRTPLNHIIGFSNIIISECQESHKKYIEKIISKAKWMAQLTNSIVDISRIESNVFTLSKQWVHVGTIFYDLFDFFTDQIHESNLFFDVNFPSNLKNKLVYIDDVRYKQILVNIISNSIKYTENGGITCDVSFLDNHILEVSISDTGCGIPWKYHKQIFEPFNRGSIKHGGNGIGLGLAISRELVGAMSGDIKFASKEGIGSKFTIRIPHLTTRHEVKTNFNLKFDKKKESSFEIFQLPDNCDLKAMLKIKAQECEMLKERKIIYEIKDFALGIGKIGKEHNIPELIVYAQKLTESIEKFDIHSINNMLNQFSKIVSL